MKQNLSDPSPLEPSGSSACPLPPFGDIPQELIGAIAAYPEPVGYASSDGRPPTLAWHDHYRALVDRIAESIWPRWGGFTRAPGWEGPASRFMLRLTELDLALTKKLQPQHALVARQQAVGGAELGDQSLHSALFRDEDPGGRVAERPIRKYLLPHERNVLDQAALALAQSLNATKGQAELPARFQHWGQVHPTAPTLPSKRELQRPRPHQVASMLGVPFTRFNAPGATTSAMPSGHAIQGMMGVVGAVVELLPFHTFDADTLSRLRQYAVDVGDRRVFAGVHYPTDNLASWCMALSLCPHVYGASADFAWSFMSEAIRSHSLVHRQLRHEASPLLAPGLAWLDELLRP
jgi:membrane-associated phospholipid phosphatase